MNRKSADMRTYDQIDLSLPVILSYRSYTSTPGVEGKIPSSKIVPTDATTKPLSVPAPRNRKEALLSPWWKGYYQAELVEMPTQE
jgi:hypothetical protein